MKKLCCLSKKTLSIAVAYHNFFIAIFYFLWWQIKVGLGLVATVIEAKKELALALLFGGTVYFLLFLQWGSTPQLSGDMLPIQYDWYRWPILSNRTFKSAMSMSEK